MRFDDMLATVLARPAERPAERAALWRQLLDLLAQSRLGADRELSREAFDRLRALRGDVPVDIRRETARAFAGRPLPALMVAFLAADVPVVAGAILGTARLPVEDWLAVIPRLSPTGRGFLRHRRDLGSRVEAALASFGQSDLSLGRPVPVDAARSATGTTPRPEPIEHGAGEGQIRAIISRIARFRGQPRDDDTLVSENDTPPLAEFRFETSANGVIRWVEGAPRGPLVGETIATPADGAIGVDAQAPGAFRRRAPFRDARLMVAGNGPAGGEWRIAGVPVFAPSDGHFLGYRGTARRPRAEERAEPPETAPPPGGLYGGGLPADSLRQLVHELRTPLNAIGGFAEMIRRQMRGPVSTAYRNRAQTIAEQAGRLLAAVDDLDVAARLETQRLDLQRLPVDFGGVILSACSGHVAMARGRGVTLTGEVADGLPQVAGDPAAVRRMVSRLIAAATSLAGEGEAIRVRLDASSPETDSLALFVTRPARLAGLGEAELFDPGYGPEGDWPDAPLLGLGFSLHLVRRLAAAAGGALLIEEEGFVLRMPIMDGAALAGTGA